MEDRRLLMIYSVHITPYNSTISTSIKIEQSVVYYVVSSCKFIITLIYVLRNDVLL